MCIMNHRLILKALEPYSGAFLIFVIWGEIAPENMNKYRAKIHRRLTGKVKIEHLEIEKINSFFKAQNLIISEYLRCV